jgi:type I restriction enzyme S subunit
MLRPFTNYQRIELKWLEYLPDSWNILRTKQVFRLRIEKAPNNNQMELLSIYTHIGVKPRKDLEQRGNKASTTDGYWVVKKGDIISNKLLAWMGAVGVSHYEGVTSPAYDILRPIQACNTDYYHYLFRTPKYLQQFKIRSRGIMDMRLRLYFDQLGQIPVPVPPTDEQDSIVLFLNWKTAQINKFIRNKRRLIELLKEQKQNVINQAVTRGLDPNVKLKPSGVEWIGDIPEHWEVRRLKFLARIRNGQDYKEVEAESGYPVMGSGGQFAYSSAFMYEGESVLFGRKGTIDKPLYINGRFWTVDTMFYTEVSKLVSAKFLYFSALSFPFDYYSTKTALPSMTQQDLGNHPVALPPRDEQELIIQYIEEESQLIDQTISRAQREIELMREYRTRLISDVVTGQVDVRNMKCEGGSLNEDEFEDIEEVEEEIELPEGGEDDE